MYIAYSSLLVLLISLIQFVRSDEVCYKSCEEVDIQPCSAFPFGAVAQKFNAFYLSSFVASAGEVKGRLGTCGSAVLGAGFTIGRGIVNSSTETIATLLNSNLSYPFSLVAQSSLSFPNGLLYNGNVLFTNNSEVLLGSNVLSSLVVNGFSAVNGTFSQSQIDCGGLQQTWQQLSQNLQQLDNTVTFGRSNTIYYIYLPQTTQIVVGTLNANDLASSFEFSFPSGQPLPPLAIGAKPQVFLFNVAGVSVEISSFDMEVLRPYASRIVWNFYEATTIAISTTVFYGTILAPKATILSTSTGEIHGQVFAFSYANSTTQGSSAYFDTSSGYVGSYQGQMTVFNVPFVGCFSLQVTFPGGQAVTTYSSVKQTSASSATSQAITSAVTHGTGEQQSLGAMNKPNMILIFGIMSSILGLFY